MSLEAYYKRLVRATATLQVKHTIVIYTRIVGERDQAVVTRHADAVLCKIPKDSTSYTILDMSNVTCAFCKVLCLGRRIGDFVAIGRIV